MTVLTLHAGDLRTAVAVCRNCCLKNSSKTSTKKPRVLRGFSIEFPQPGDDDQENLRIIATDARQLAVCKVAIVGRDEGPLPRQLSLDIFNLKINSVGKSLTHVTAVVTDTGVSFTCGSSKNDKIVRCNVWELRNNETEIRYPNWRPFLPNNLADDAIGILKIKNKEWVTNWTNYRESIGQQKLFIGRNGISGKPIAPHFELTGDVRLERGDAFAVGVDMDLVVNHLRHLRSPVSTAYFRGEDKPIVITTTFDSIQYVLSPLATRA